MLMSTGPIALARPGWGLKGNATTAVVANGTEGHPETLCAQMLLGAAVSSVKVLVLLPGGRDEDPTWQALGHLLGGGDPKAAARELRQMMLVMYASGTGREHVAKAGLVYAPGLQAGELEQLAGKTSAPVLTLTDIGSEAVMKKASEVIHVGGDMIALDSAGFRISVVHDASGPFYQQA